MEQYNKEQEKEKAWIPLTMEEREEIAIGLALGESRRVIARRIGRDKSTVSREIKRNGSAVYDCRYRANRAQQRAEERSRESHIRERLADERVRQYVEEKLKESWTPERIAGRISIDFPGLATNYESIYQWIYAERRDLIQYLVRGHKKRQKRSKVKKSRVWKIPGRIDISERPVEIESRKEAGHWEVDTVVSRQGRAAVAVLVERKTRFFLAVWIKDKTAEEMKKAVIKALRKLPKRLRKTLTFDNGLENALHELINEALETKSYFCKPYHSWEKGSIENRNGILRRFFPKKHNWDLTTQKEIDRVVRRINSMPMKCHGFRTPNEVFSRYGGVALAA